MIGDTPFRQFLRRQVSEGASRAIDENARRIRYQGPELYRRMVEEQLPLRQCNRLVLAVCAQKPKSINPDNAYFDLFRKFAEAQAKDFPGEISVCRIFLRRGKSLAVPRNGDDADYHTSKAYRFHKQNRESGMIGLQVNISELDWVEARAFTRANAREHFGFLVFIDPEGSFAITHAGPDDGFHFSEWRDAANVRELVSLFDSLLIRTDEFRISAETDDQPKLDPCKILQPGDMPLLEPLRMLRQRIGTMRTSPGSAIAWPSADEILEVTEPDGWPGVHVIGSFARQSTFYQTQIRAINLAWALLRSRVDKPTRIAVIGDGIAGMTFTAAALAILRDTVSCVHMFGDQKQYGDTVPYVRFQVSSNRLLHPHIYTWPQVGWANVEAELPVLPWSAGEAKDVAEHIISDFKTSYEASDFTWHHGAPSVSSAEDGNYSLDNGDAKYDFVIFAVGFGEELAKDPYRYWDGTTQITRRPEKGQTPTILVSGNGDGALMDLATATLVEYEDNLKFPNELLQKLGEFQLGSASDDVSSVKTEQGAASSEPSSDTLNQILNSIVEIEKIIDEFGDYSDKLNLWRMYESRFEKTIMDNREQLVTALIRQDRRVVFCAGTLKVFKAETSALNRYVAYIILKLIGFQPSDIRLGPQIDMQHPTINDAVPRDYVPCPSVDDIETWKAKQFDKVIKRFGTRDRRDRKEVAAAEVPEKWKENADIYRASKHMWFDRRIDRLAELNPAAEEFVRARSKETKAAVESGTNR